MFRTVFIVFFALSNAPLFATEKFVDCGPGFVSAPVKSMDGISAFECKRLWCRDLENGKVMGRDNGTPNSGYELKTAKGDWIRGQAEDNNGNVIECFGRRKWCTGETIGNAQPQFNTDIGIYYKGGKDGDNYRSALGGNGCWYWQLQNHNCNAEAGETAMLKDGVWVCAVQASTSQARSAIKARAIRRTAGVTSIRLKR